jgi:5-methylthioribose kinase
MSQLSERRGYRILKEAEVARYVADGPARDALGGHPAGWRVREVGDGNLNLVFIVEGDPGGIVVKQALPYVRLVGESWPLPLDRSYYEAEALAAQARVAEGLIPRVHAYDHDLAAIVMEFLSPHIILRKGLIAGRVYPDLHRHVGRFMARTLFHTSDLAMPAAAKKAEIAKFAGNTALAKITEDLVFTDPYWRAPMNAWMPALEEPAASIRADGDLKIAAQELKHRFLSSAEALVHGDLHSGSIMVTETDTRVIDPEFAFYGPMGFDTGAYFANLLLAFLSQRGHEAEGPRDAYRRYVLDQIASTWAVFEAEFRALWAVETRTGDAYARQLFEDQGDLAALAKARDRFMERLLADTLGFAGAKMIRRILGLAKVADMETIADPAVAAACKTRALRLGRDLLVRRAEFRDMATVIALAEAMDGGSIR